MKFESIQEVVDQGLCTGCGACVYAQPQKLKMIDVAEEGRRPAVREGSAPSSDELSLNACPGIRLMHTYDQNAAGLFKDLEEAWGPILGVWEGSAADSQIRFSGSSGGAATALSHYAIDSGQAKFAIGIRGRDDKPHLNETVFNRSRAELLRSTGSRYAPASPCERLREAEATGERFVFVGKPCDVAATKKLSSASETLDSSIALTIAFFCAGTPSTLGTTSLLKQMGVADVGTLSNLRYRGLGWPGSAVAEYESDGVTSKASWSYEDSWGHLTKYVQWRCRLCLDHTGEFADISVGDPWYRPTETEGAGSSLIVARTARGLRFIENAIEAGYISARAADSSILPKSQPNLLKARSSVWGRMLGARLVGAKIPVFERMAARSLWVRGFGLIDKLRSIFGASRRVLAQRRRKLS